MGGCKLLPNTCAPPDAATPAPNQTEDELVVNNFINAVWNYQWLPGDEYYFLPPGLRTALTTYLDPSFVRLRMDQSGNLKQGAGISALGGCVRRIHETSPNFHITVQQIAARDDRVMATLLLSGMDNQNNNPHFITDVAALYKLTGPPGSRKIIEDLALSGVVKQSVQGGYTFE